MLCDSTLAFHYSNFNVQPRNFSKNRNKNLNDFNSEH
jgi:hypothetical protein